jgi:DNA (cytosine-5)-methyltransferase 1
MPKIAVIDLFCGIGGLSHGFVREGFNVVAGFDTDPSCKYPFETNNRAKFIQKDVQKVTPKEILALFGNAQVTILAGCAPCQPFSKYTNGQPENEKWHLLRKFAKLVIETKPDVVTMENVIELRKHLIFDDFVTALEDHGYWVTFQEVSAIDYGIAQNRNRLVLFASRWGEVELVPKTHRGRRKRTVRDVIGGLPPIRAGQAHKSDPLHKARALNKINRLRLLSTRPGGSWRDWDLKLRLNCHRKKSGKKYGAVYGRMEWNKPAPTMTTHCCGIGNGRFGHPSQTRAISVREAALLQSFSKYYELEDPNDPLTNRLMCQHIGNAVPVRLGRIVARSIKRHIERCFKFDSRLRS